MRRNYQEMRNVNTKYATVLVGLKYYVVHAALVNRKACWSYRVVCVSLPRTFSISDYASRVPPASETVKERRRKLHNVLLRYLIASKPHGPNGLRGLLAPQRAAKVVVVTAIEVSEVN